MSDDDYTRQLALKRWAKIDVKQVDEGGPRVQFFIKAVIVEGKGYCVMVTDMLEIYQEILVEAEWMDRWKQLDCNGQIGIRGNGLLEFLTYNLEGVYNPKDGIQWNLKRDFVDGRKCLSLQLVDTSTAARFALKWKMILKIHPDSIGMLYMHVTLPLAAMLSYRNSEAQSLLDAIEDRDDIIRTLANDVKEAGITLQRGTRTKPLVRYDEIKSRKAEESNFTPAKLLDDGVATLYEDVVPNVVDWTPFTFRENPPKIPAAQRTLMSVPSTSDLKRGLSTRPTLDLHDPNSVVPEVAPLEHLPPAHDEDSEPPKKKKKKKKRDREL